MHKDFQDNLVQKGNFYFTKLRPSNFTYEIKDGEFIEIFLR